MGGKKAYTTSSIMRISQVMVKSQWKKSSWRVACQKLVE